MISKEQLVHLAMTTKVPILNPIRQYFSFIKSQKGCSSCRQQPSNILPDNIYRALIATQEFNLQVNDLVVLLQNSR